MAYIYTHTNPHTNKVFYVGCCYSNNDRINDTHNRNQAWINEVEKIGGFHKVIKEKVIVGDYSEQEIRSLEYRLAQTLYEQDEAYCTFEHDLHGENNPNYGNYWTEEQKQRLSRIQTGRYVGENNPNYGNKWNQRQRDHQSQLMIERYNNGFINGRALHVILHMPNGVTHSFVQKKDMYNFMLKEYKYKIPDNLPPNTYYTTPYKKRKFLEGTWYEVVSK